MFRGEFEELNGPGKTRIIGAVKDRVEESF